MAYIPEPNDRPPGYVIALAAIVGIACALMAWGVTTIIFTIPG